VGPAARRADRPRALPGPSRRARLASSTKDDDPDDEFVFGLERVLDGIEALVRVRAA
jgi:hypothetical protein